MTGTDPRKWPYMLAAAFVLAPEGPPGPQGIPGPEGPPGPAGTPGSPCPNTAVIEGITVCIP